MNDITKRALADAFKNLASKKDVSEITIKEITDKCGLKRQTFYNHFKDTGRKPNDYDIIATGDLGKVGKEITTKLLLDYGYDISNNYIDCGDIIFDDERQKTDCGGSGCGCSAVVTCGYLYKKLMKREIKSILLVSTGALMSTTSSLQGESIPGIAHAVAIEF